MAAVSSIASSAVFSPSPSDNEELELRATEGGKCTKKKLGDASIRRLIEEYEARPCFLIS